MRTPIFTLSGYRFCFWHVIRIYRFILLFSSSSKPYLTVQRVMDQTASTPLPPVTPAPSVTPTPGHPLSASAASSKPKPARRPIGKPANIFADKPERALFFLTLKSPIRRFAVISYLTRVETISLPKTDYVYNS